jgi:hypothetical protein
MDQLGDKKEILEFGEAIIILGSKDYAIGLLFVIHGPMMSEMRLYQLPTPIPLRKKKMKR